MFLARRAAAIGLLVLLALGAMISADARAQQIFRSVGPDGRVTFSDKPPLDANAKASLAPAARSGTGSNIGTLPYELREAASRFPVTLYTAPGCGTCDSGRTLLSGRGVPFTEKTIISNEDVQALQRISGASSVPFMTVGGQQLKGFSEVEWSQFLDAAGYPKTSQLPSSYIQTAATPLVTVESPTVRPLAPGRPETAAAQTDDTDAAREPPATSADNPTGIRF